MTTPPFIVHAAQQVATLAQHHDPGGHLAGRPGPSRRQTAAILRALADFAHTRHIAGVVATAAEQRHSPTAALSEYLRQLATALATRRLTPGAEPMTLDGMHPAKRVALALGWDAIMADLAGEPRPTLEQAASVLAGLADPWTASLLAGPQVINLAQPGTRAGYQHAIALHRYFTQAADHLACAEPTIQSAPASSTPAAA